MTDLTPQPPTRWRSILHCCRPQAPESTEDVTVRLDEIDVCNQEPPKAIEHAREGSILNCCRPRAPESTEDPTASSNEINEWNENPSKAVERARSALREAGAARERLRSKIEYLEAVLLRSEKVAVLKASEVKGLCAEIRARERRPARSAAGVENLTRDLENSATRRDELTPANAPVRRDELSSENGNSIRQAGSSRSNGLAVDFKAYKIRGNIADKLVEKIDTMQYEIETLVRDVAEICAAKDAALKELREDLQIGNLSRPRKN